MGFSSDAGGLGGKCDIITAGKSWAIVSSQRSRHIPVPILQVSQCSGLKHFFFFITKILYPEKISLKKLENIQNL